MKCVEKSEQICLLGLTLMKGVGNVLARYLVQHLGSAERVFQVKKHLLESVPGVGECRASQILENRAKALTRAEKEYLFIEKNKIRLYTIFDKEYPYRLQECPDAPLVFFYKGNADLNNSRILSVVGTRKATSYGTLLTETLIKELSKSDPDLIIVSGLAYGIDICAHSNSLKNGLQTIGVLAHGLDRIYPSAHRNVAIEMINQGGLLTDFISETEPDRENFLQRNRLIAGLSDATLVVESARKGGALVTADIAFSYGRDVYAFSGRTTDIQSEGCNRLIQVNKAGLIASAADLLEALGWNCKKSDQTQQAKLFFTDRIDHPIVALLAKEGELHINEIVEKTGTPVHELMTKLFDLELNGHIRTLPGGVYQLN